MKYSMWVILDEPDQMRFETFGSISIFRPRFSIEVELRIEAENHLRAKYSTGKYTQKELINEILQYQFSFFTNKLEDLLPGLASVHFLEFVLAEYDKAAQVEVLYKKNGLVAEEISQWADLGRNLKRAIKYLAERITLFEPDQSPSSPESQLLTTLEKVWICAEELVSYYILSDQTFLLFPDNTVLEILPEGQSNYWALEIIGNQCAIDFQERTRVDTVNRSRFIPKPQFDINHSEHDKILADSFQETIGTSYHNVLKILGTLIDGATPPENGFPIPFIHRSNTIASLSEHFNLSPEIIERILLGFSISKQKLESEGREIWKPKQEYRAFRRGIFEVPHPTGQHLIFSKELAKESLLLLLTGVTFQQLPPEWHSDKVNLALKTLSNVAGKWFEQVVLENFGIAKIFGAKSLNRGIGQGDKRIQIPAEVGEIDFLGYSSPEELLLIAECKMVMGKTEPRLFRDELSQFVISNDAYFKKFSKKIEWVYSNLESVCEALSTVQMYETSVKPKRLATVVVTYYPTIASCFTTSFPCVTITEIMIQYEAQNRWPYDIGVFNC